MPSTLPTIVAHRGIHHAFPENSLDAFRAAWEAGITWCECDIRGSSDHEPFVLHDAALDRTTTGAGLAIECVADQIRQLNLKHGSGEPTGARVPSLVELIQAMPTTGRLLIEIKSPASDQLIRRTLELCSSDTCVVQSFDGYMLHMSQQVRPKIPRVLLVSDAADQQTFQRGPWSGINAQHKSLTPELVERIRKMEVSVGAWTVNEPADIQRMLELRLDVIISDEPVRVRDATDAGKSDKN